MRETGSARHLQFDGPDIMGSFFKDLIIKATLISFGGEQLSAYSRKWQVTSPQLSIDVCNQERHTKTATYG
jgi:hypothetical protein